MHQIIKKLQYIIYSSYQAHNSKIEQSYNLHLLNNVPLFKVE